MSELQTLRLRSGARDLPTAHPLWFVATKTSPGWAPRTLLLRSNGQLQAAVFLVERTIFGVPTGYFRGRDAVGEMLILCEEGCEDQLLTLALETALKNRSAFFILLDRPPHRELLSQSKFTLQSSPETVNWRLPLQDTFDSTIAPLGRRTRRNLRHALRSVQKHGWKFIPEMTYAQAVEATSQLNKSSTHAISRPVSESRLRLLQQTPGSFSMGFWTADGRCLSFLAGRRVGSTTEIFWQSNTRGLEKDSLCIMMRALLMQEEVSRGTASLCYLGGTCPLMTHCCVTEPSQQIALSRPGIRAWLTSLLMKTSWPSAEHPLRRYL